jgi:Protein of unknown function (DUF551)
MKWINIKDRVPATAGFYLVADTFLGIVEKVEFDGISRWNWIMHVTHWMPLPEPPEENE